MKDFKWVWRRIRRKLEVVRWGAAGCDSTAEF